MKRFLWLGALLCLVGLWAGCGDTFRPVIIPNPPAFPDPRSSHSVISINNNNGTANQGTVLQVDVSGDSEMVISNVGYSPVHMVQQTFNQTLVVNEAGGSAFSESVMKLINTGAGFNITTISLPSGSAPNFVAVAPNSNTAYVSLPGTAPASIAVVNTTQNNVPSTITLPSGSFPIALAVTPDNNRMYVADNSNGTISGFNTIDRSLRNTIALSAKPIWVLPRSDNHRVYVLEQDGTVATLDTSSTAGPDTLIATTPTGSGVSTMLYDGNLNRLYVPTTSQLIVLDVSQSTPQPLPPVTLPAPGVAVAALPDGSRVYTASNGAAQITNLNISSVSGDGTTATYTFPAGQTTVLPQTGMALTISGGNDGFDGDYIVTAATSTTFQVASTATGSGGARVANGSNFLPQVTVINTSGDQVKTTISMPAAPASGPYEPAVCSTTRFRFTMAVAGDSSRVYMATCDSGKIDLINTFNDTFLLTLPAPASARPPVPPSTQPPPQNPVFLIAGP